MKLNLQQFAGSLTVTVYKDEHMTTASASPASSLAEGDEVTMTLTPASGYEVDEVECLSGGVTVNLETKKFTMGESSVVLVAKSKANNLYKIVENTYVSVNGTVTRLARNMEIKYGVNGAVIGVNSGKAAVTLSADIIKALVDAGAIVKI